MKRLVPVHLKTFLMARIHLTRTTSDRGASVVEWVITTAIIAGAILGLISLIKVLVAQRMGVIQSDW
ncbi:hypothetical protein [Nonomuraea sp. NPDC049709]|uniref:hypothetical protein n=1 Tax=Nonomuraea sp. NPDC049709 TaxID=3154736 RepID=UPI003428061E